MIEATIYEAETGTIRRVITVANAAEVEANVQPGEAWFAGRADYRNQVVIDGALAVRAPNNKAAWRLLRQMRDLKLANSDWTQLPDAAVDQAAWAAYRAALRRLPDETEDPNFPKWPEAPRSRA